LEFEIGEAADVVQDLIDRCSLLVRDGLKSVDLVVASPGISAGGIREGERCRIPLVAPQDAVDILVAARIDLHAAWFRHGDGSCGGRSLVRPLRRARSGTLMARTRRIGRL